MTPLSKLQKRHDNSHACWKKAACSMLEQSKTARESKKKKIFPIVMSVSKK